MSPEYREEVYDTTGQSISANRAPLLIGDALHVLNQRVHRAIVEKEGEVIARLVQEQVDAGVQALAVNLGPGRMMGESISWVVDTIREHTGIPLFFSATIFGQKQILREQGSMIAINAVTADRDEMMKAMIIAQECGSSLVVLLVQPGKAIVSVDDRILLASEVLELAEQNSFPFSRLYLDPVFTTRPDPVAWHVSRGLPDVDTLIETISLIKQLDSRVKTIAALSNGTSGMAREQKSSFHCRMLPLFAGVGLDAVLLNCLDTKVMEAVREIKYGRSLHQCGGEKQVGLYA
jgi:5-methyltetrahydrofolate corrinoid/iron sulfur protein methyltransferase